AARAGEAGRGFSVVATEVSRLAENSNQNTKFIDDIIGENARLIGEGVTASARSADIVTKFLKVFGSLRDHFTNLQSILGEQESLHSAFRAAATQANSTVRIVRESTSEQRRGSNEIMNSMANLERSMAYLVGQGHVLEESIDRLRMESKLLRQVEA